MTTINHYTTSNSTNSGSGSNTSPKGSLNNPYTVDEFDAIPYKEWKGGYVEGMGYVPRWTEVIGSSTSNAYSDNFSDWLSDWNWGEYSHPFSHMGSTPEPGGSGGNGGNNQNPNTPNHDGQTGGGGTQKSQKEKALEQIQAFSKRNHESVAYPNINKTNFAKILKLHVYRPDIIQQGKNGTCGAAVICKYLAEFMPEKYVQVAISLYENGQYTPWNLHVAEDSKIGDDAQLQQIGTTSVDAIMQGAITNSRNIVLDYNPFSDGSGLKSFLWPTAMKNFLSDTLGLDVTVVNIARYQELANIDYGKYFVIAAVVSEPLSDAYVEYKLTTTSPVPTHYIQVTGIYDEKGISFWHWGSNNNHTINVETYFIYKVEKK